MAGYKFYVKTDINKEAVNTWPARSKEEATEYFAKLKRMSVESFLKIFEVEKL